MEIKSKKISNNLTINKLMLDAKKEANVVPSGKNVIFAIDVSGSMYGELPKIRQQLKNKIPDLISDRDTISIIWFSGRNQSGVLKEGVKVKNLTDLQKLNDAIDRFLVPMGCTAFLPPINLAKTVINNLSSNGNYFSFIFLSDGYNNDSVWSDVINELKTLEPLVSNATFIEYGYYADSDALTEMSEIVGGEKIFSKDFDSYDEQFSDVINRNSSVKRSVDISNLKSNLLFQYFYTIDKENKVINVYSSEDKNEILIPEDIMDIYFLSNTQYYPCELGNCEILAAAYILAERLKYDFVEDILAFIGDVDLFNQFCGAYGKQKLNELKDKIKELTFNTELLYLDKEKSNSLVIDQNQYCLMDLIKELQDGHNYFYPYHEAFNYNRIGTKKVTKVELTEEAKEALNKAKTLKEIEAVTKDISAPEFIYPDNASKIGMSFKTLVWNQDRANLSVQTKLNGKVKLPKNEFGLEEVDSFIYRNFTLIKDGILNVNEIPVVLEFDIFKKLSEMGLVKKYVTGYNDILDVKDFKPLVILDISKLPTINRSMIKNASANSLANLEFDLIKCQAKQKYLKYVKEELSKNEPGQDESSMWTTEVSDWLKSIGVTENGGFSPKVEAIQSEDFYIAPVLKTKIEKMSSIPKISDVIKKSENGKTLNIIEGLVNKLGSSIISEFENNFKLEDIENYIEKVDEERRKCLVDIARIKFGVILSRSWFSEFETLNENTLNLKFDEIDCTLKVTFDYKDTPIKL